MIVSKYHKTPRSLSFISFHSIVEPMMMEQHKYLQRKQEIKLLSYYFLNRHIMIPEFTNWKEIWMNRERGKDTQNIESDLVLSKNLKKWATSIIYGPFKNC